MTMPAAATSAITALLEIIRIFTLLLVDVTDGGSGNIAAGHPASTHLDKKNDSRTLLVSNIYMRNWIQQYLR
jgi:hypothetical protein